MGGSFGAGDYSICGRAYDPDFLFSWPSSRISVMGGAQAADVLTTVKRQQLARRQENLAPEVEAEMKREILEKYEREGSPYYATARLWDDGLIDPRHTRGHLIRALASTLHHSWRNSFGIFRM